MKFDPASLNAALDKIGSAAAEVRPVAQAGAQVLYDEVLRRVPVSSKGHWFHGRDFRRTGKKYWFEPGSLRSSIYQAFSKDNSGAGRATYHISWNRLKAPYARMVEFGTPRAPAHPFVRPAYDAKVGEALEASRLRWTDDMRTLIASMK